MQSILEELYSGNIVFDSEQYIENSPYVKAASRKWDSMEKLNKMLEGKEKELFRQYCDARSEVEGITHYDTFAAALKFGVLLMAEVFANGRCGIGK